MNDPIIESCLTKVIGSPNCLSEDISNIRMTLDNTRVLKTVLKEYLDEETIKEIQDNIYESRIVPDQYDALFRNGSFRVFSIYNYEKDMGNVLYIIFYDPYHLIFHKEKNRSTGYDRRKGYLGSELVSIFEKYHKKVDEKLIIDFKGLKI